MEIHFFTVKGGIFFIFICDKKIQKMEIQKMRKMMAVDVHTFRTSNGHFHFD